MFMNFNKNTSKYDDAFLAQTELDDYLKIPLVFEQEFIQNDKLIEQSLKKLINYAGPKNRFTQDCPDMPALCDHI